MKYEDIRLNVSNDSISDYKVFKGIKLYSEMFKAEDGKKLINKRVFVTPKKNYDSSFDLSDKNHNIIFEVTSELDDFSKYLDEEVIKKIIMKEKREEIVEVLDIWDCVKFCV